MTGPARGFEQVLQVVLEHLNELLPLLTASTRARMLELLDKEKDAGSKTAAWAARGEMSELLLAVLPDGHPVRAAVLNATRGPAQVESSIDTARELLERLDGAGAGESDPTPLEVDYWSTRRLLAEPSMGEDDIRMLGLDPGAPDLIRLQTFDGSARWPEFQFGPDGTPLPVVVAVNRILEATEDPWGTADWWLGGNVWLGGVPAELLGTFPDTALISAAEATDPGV